MFYKNEHLLGFMEEKGLLKDTEIVSFLKKYLFTEFSIKFFTEKIKYSHLNHLQQKYIENYLRTDKVLVILCFL